VVVEMKLNGKFYLREETILNIIEDIIILLETGSYYVISDKIRNIEPTNAENVATKLALFQDMFRAFFKKENYCKYDDAVDMVDANMYDPKKESVKLFTQGAYGIIIKADSESADRYIFNICLRVFIARLRKIK
jgi:hypothetical protein